MVGHTVNIIFTNIPISNMNLFFRSMEYRVLPDSRKGDHQKPAFGHYSHSEEGVEGVLRL